jgi:hypothetical protein
MRVKRAVNRMLAKLGYSIVARTTLAKLIEERANARDQPLTEIQHHPAAAAVEITPEVSVIESRFRLAQAANDPPRVCTLLAPKFDPGATPSPLAQHIVEFQEKGITVIGTSRLKATAWREAEIFDRDVGNLHSAWDWAGGARYPDSNDRRTGVPSPSLIDDLRTLFTSADFEAFFLGVLGCPAMVANCRLVKSLPHSGEGTGPQSWHQDGSPPGVIRGVLYLTDVDEGNGPFQFRDEADNLHTVRGHAGDLLVFDAMRLRHRAMPPLHNFRAAIDLVFMPRLPHQKFQIIDAGMNHWPADPFVYTIPNERGRLNGSR